MIYQNKIQIDLDHELWKERIDTLIYAELKLKYLHKQGKISEKEKKKLQKIIKKRWLQVSDSHSHTNPSLEEAFKLNFSQ